MHPFIHSFNPAISPPWQTKTDYELFGLMAKKFGEYADTHLGKRKDVVATPLQHDTPDVMATPKGKVTDLPLVPGVTMPKLAVVERDYPNIFEQWRALGPLTEKLGLTTKGINYRAEPELKKLAAVNGTVPKRPVRRGGTP